MLRRGLVTNRNGATKKRYKKKNTTKRVKNRTELFTRWTGGLLRKTTGASHTRSMLYKSSSDRILLKTKLVSDLDPVESRQIDTLIKEAFGDSSITHIDGMNYCIFSKIGKKVISAMFLKKTCQVPGSLSPSSPNSDCMYIHTVCVSNEYRGRGLLHKMLFYISKIERFKKTLFKLEAANTQDHGLNQDARFQIYSKSGFTLPIGTFVEPHRFTIKNVETSNKNEKKITYTVERDDGGVHIIQYNDIHPEACYFDNVKQNRGCIMETTSSKLRDFNAQK